MNFHGGRGEGAPNVSSSIDPRPSFSQQPQMEMTMKKYPVGTVIRQGDVALVYIETIPASAIEDTKDKHGLAVLAYGEVSGHAHLVEELEPQTVSYRRTPEGERFLSLLGQTLIKHGNLTQTGIQDGTADHSALLLREGKLMQAFQCEDFGEEARRVAD